MTPDVLRWVGMWMSVLSPQTVLDIGAYDENGNPRAMCRGYVGLDMRAGPNVDIQANAHSLPCYDSSFDCVLCLETLEHDDEPLTTIREAHRVLKPDGVFIVTVPGIKFPRHDFPCDYWRVTVDGLAVWLRPFVRTQIDENGAEYSVRGIAWKQS